METPISLDLGIKYRQLMSHHLETRLTRQVLVLTLTKHEALMWHDDVVNDMKLCLHGSRCT